MALAMGGSQCYNVIIGGKNVNSSIILLYLYIYLLTFPIQTISIKLCSFWHYTRSSCELTYVTFPLYNYQTPSLSLPPSFLAIAIYLTFYPCFLLFSATFSHEVKNERSIELAQIIKNYIKDTM